MNLYEVVMKLVGPVCPTGDHNTDQERLKNMKALTELVDRLLFDIGEADQYAGDRGSTPLGTMRFSSFSKDPRGTVWGTGDFFYLHLREIWHTPRDSYGTVGCEKIVTG